MYAINSILSVEEKSKIPPDLISEHQFSLGMFQDQPNIKMPHMLLVFCQQCEEYIILINFLRIFVIKYSNRTITWVVWIIDILVFG